MTISQLLTDKCRLAGANIITMAMPVVRAAAARDYPVPVPTARQCRLIRAEAITTTAVASADFLIDLELNAAGGSAIGTITIATSGSAVGTIDTLEWKDMTQANANGLSSADSARDYINLETSANAAAGAAWVFLFFERDPLQ